MRNFFSRSPALVQPICTDAAMAIKAAKGFRTWGAFAASRFAAKHGVPAKLVRIARQLEAATKEGF